MDLEIFAYIAAIIVVPLMLIQIFVRKRPKSTKNTTIKTGDNSPVIHNSKNSTIQQNSAGNS